MDITLVYYANGGDSTPATDVEAIPSGSSSASFVLADAITRDAPTGKYNFKGWEVNGAMYDAGETINLSENCLATAIFEINSTSVSTKEYGYSPNGTKNALGTTRYHHQPSYPHPMGVGAKRTSKPTVPPTPTPTMVQIMANRFHETTAPEETVKYSIDGGDYISLDWGMSAEVEEGKRIKFQINAGDGRKVKVIKNAAETTVDWEHWNPSLVSGQLYAVEFVATLGEQGFLVYFENQE